MNKLIAAFALTITALTATGSSPVEARAGACYAWYGANFMGADCTSGNYGDPFYVSFKCEKGSWFWYQSYTEYGNVGRVGYYGQQNTSFGRCNPGYTRSGGGTIVTP